MPIFSEPCVDIGSHFYLLAVSFVRIQHRFTIAAFSDVLDKLILLQTGSSSTW